MSQGGGRRLLVASSVLAIAWIGLAWVTTNAARDSATAASEQPRWEFSDAVISGPSGDLVSAVGRWVGPLPAPSYASRCHARVVSETGSTIWRSNDIDLDTAWTESDREGQGISFAGDPAVLALGRPVIECFPLRPGGWVVRTAQPEEARSDSEHAHEASAGKPPWLVAASLEWQGDRVRGLLSVCTFELWNTRHESLGRRVVSFDSPRPNSAESVTTRGTIPVKVPGRASPSAASGSCHLAGPEEVEGGD